jgi:hypothetical protein
MFLTPRIDKELESGWEKMKQRMKNNQDSTLRSSKRNKAETMEEVAVISSYASPSY